VVTLAGGWGLFLLGALVLLTLLAQGMAEVLRWEPTF
jgi:hypothetical protein